LLIANESLGAFDRFIDSMIIFGVAFLIAMTKNISKISVSVYLTVLYNNDVGK
jgi:hypothetical protein